MKRSNRNSICTLFLAFFLCVLGSLTVLAQGTAFTYQSRLSDNGALANGTYDLEFSLFDALNGGTQIGATLAKPNVTLSNGVFIVQLDFGANAFTSGGLRFLQIGVRKASTSDAFTTLSPRTEITSTPYAIRSLSAVSADNATQLNGVAAGDYVKTDDARLSDARDPKPGSANYVQNSTSPQAATHFNISGNGTAGGTLSGGTVNAVTQFSLGGVRVLSMTSQSNLFLGKNGGIANTTGFDNTFSGVEAGHSNTIGFRNTFSGAVAGFSNTTGTYNTFSGANAGRLNTTGGANTFSGTEAGGLNTTGGGNTFSGANAGYVNTTGSYNTLNGYFANVGSGDLRNASALGARAIVGCSNCLVLGSIAGMNSASDNTNVGIGTTTPTSRLHVAGGDIRWGDSFLTPDQGGSIELGTPNSIQPVTPYIDFHYSSGSVIPGLDYNVRLINDVSGRLSVFGNLNVTTNISATGKISANSGFNGRCLNGGFGNTSFNGSFGNSCNMDLAESFRTLQRTEPGDVVTLLAQDRDRPTVRKAQRAYDAHLVGVVSTNPGLIFDEGQTHLAGDNTQLITKDKTAVAMVGRVPVKFTLENGTIKVGDALTSSATEPGKAMKATSAGKIIGIALESSDKATDGKLLMWLQVGHYEPTNTTVASRNPSRKRQGAVLTVLKRENQMLQQQLHTVLRQLKTVGTRLDELERAATQTSTDAQQW